MKLSILLLTIAAAGSLPAQEKGPISQLPYYPSLDVSSMDKSANACEDFYRYSCGSWNKNNPMPPDQASWDVYGKLTFDNERFLWGLLEEAAKPTPSRTAAEQQIGDYYHACMDEESVEKAGLAPIQERLDRIARITSLSEIAGFAAAQHRAGTGDGLIFGFSSGQDYENSQSVIAFASRGELGLPDRDYYSKTDPKSVEIRQKYVDHMTRMFGMLGDDATAARKYAEQVMAIETALAASMLTRVEMRNPHNLLHKFNRTQLKTLSPTLDWSAFLGEVGQDKVKVVNVEEPAFYRALEKELHAHSVGEWQSLLRWNILRDNASYLSKAFVNAHFEV